MKLVIEKAKWAKGTHMTVDGRMCAVGFYLNALGKVTQEGRQVLAEDLESDPLTQWLVERHEDEWGTDVCDFSDEWSSITNANDYPILRQNIIKTIFANHGVEVEFVGFEEEQT